METSTKVFFVIVTLTALGACCKAKRGDKLTMEEKAELAR